MHHFQDIDGIMVEPFLDALPVAQWDRRSPKAKVDLDAPSMDSYSTIHL